MDCWSSAKWKVKMSDEQEATLVSIVIPCYNQAHFLPESIQSVLAQTHAPCEIVVVDDGSSDSTAVVAGEYPRVRCVRQKNQGLSGARNTGFRASRGEYIMFLDADDRLTPIAAEAHLRCFAENPNAGFVVGGIDLISKDGSHLRSPRWPDLSANHYEQLLKANHVANTIAVMFRRSVLEAVGEFNTSLPASEDYEMLLRIARLFPGIHHDAVVAQYRRHNSNMSRNGVLMLGTMHRVMESQRGFVKGNPRLEAAWKRGEIYWRDRYGAVTIKQVVAHLVRGHFFEAMRALGVMLRHVRGRILILPWKYRERALASVGSRFASFRKRST